MGRKPEPRKQQPKNGREAVARADVPGGTIRVLSVCGERRCVLPASYAAEGYPLKASLPVLIPVWAFSLALALFCAAVLSGAQLRRSGANRSA